MIEKIVRAYLKDALAIPVYMEEQATMPASYLVLEKTSDSGRHISHAVMAIQSYAPTRQQAAELSDRVVAALDGLLAHEAIISVDLDSEYDWTDTERKRYRYQAVVDIHYYREERS